MLTARVLAVTIRIVCIDSSAVKLPKEPFDKEIKRRTDWSVRLSFEVHQEYITQ